MGSRDATVNFNNNTRGLRPKEGISLIKSYFSAELLTFEFVREYDDPHGYWGVLFTDNLTTVFIGSERSFIDYSIEINGNKIDLSDFDDRINFLEKTSQENYLFLLDVIKKYLTIVR